jgi:hypothetical protein
MPVAARRPTHKHLVFLHSSDAVPSFLFTDRKVILSLQKIPFLVWPAELQLSGNQRLTEPGSRQVTEAAAGITFATGSRIRIARLLAMYDLRSLNHGKCPGC